MPRPIYRYEPNNSNPDKAIGVLLPFNKDADGRTTSQNALSGSVGGGSVFRQSYTTEEQSISNLKNLLLTAKGERYMQPDFGTDIQETLFEPNTDVVRDRLRASLEEDIGFWLPYIIINKIDIVPDVDRYNLSVRIRYQVESANAERVIIILANENEVVLSEIGDNPLELQQVGLF